MQTNEHMFSVANLTIKIAIKTKFTIEISWPNLLEWSNKLNFLM